MGAEIDFSKLEELICSPGYHYTAHNFLDGYRSSEKAIPGFDLLILDIDSGTSINTAMELLSDYTAMYATTKRHTADKHRFRVVLPMSHFIKLSPKDYSKFMENVFNWLPFDTDTATKDIARKWMSHNGEAHFNEGELIDATLFIPQTKKAMEQEKMLLDAKGMDNMERWFHTRIETGNRATMMIRYGFMLVDNELPLDFIMAKLHQFNDKLPDPLPREELDTKIQISLSRKIIQKENI